MVGFLDADLSTPLNEFKKLVQLLDSKSDLKIVCGSRIRRMGTHINRSFKRHYLGRIIATIISNMLQLPFYDTQCGAKIFRREIAGFIFKDEFKSKWLFDVEIFFRLKEKYSLDELNNMILEYPLEVWKEVGDSKIELRDTLGMPIELWKIRKHYKN